MEATCRTEEAKSTIRSKGTGSGTIARPDSDPIYEDEYGNVVPPRPAPSGGAAYSVLPTGEAAVNLGALDQGEFSLLEH